MYTISIHQSVLARNVAVDDPISASSSCGFDPWITARSFMSFCSSFVRCASPACSSANTYTVPVSPRLTQTLITRTHLRDLRKPVLVHDRPLDTARPAVSLARGRYRADESPQLIQLPAYPPRPAGPPHLLVDLVQRASQRLLFRAKRGRA